MHKLESFFRKKVHHDLISQFSCFLTHYCQLRRNQRRDKPLCSFCLSTFISILLAIHLNHCQLDFWQLFLVQIFRKPFLVPSFCGPFAIILLLLVAIVIFFFLENLRKKLHRKLIKIYDK